MNAKRVFVALGICFLLAAGGLLSGCGSGQSLEPTVTPSVVPTDTPAPTSTLTSTPAPTVTFTPTVTPSPTFTPTPTIEPPVQLSNLFEGARLTYFESFDDYSALEQWNAQACQTVNNGVLEYVCTNGFFSKKTDSFQEGEGVLIDFKYAKQTGDYYWGINFSNGTWAKDDWRQFGVSNSAGYGQSVSLTKGTNFFGPNPRWTKADVWYRLVLAVGEKGRIAVLVWERDKPNAKPWKYSNTMGKDWSGLEWSFWINNVNDVALAFDNYYEFAFSKIK